ncbi:MAG: hypothetical protein K2X81_17180, partial [Candidatus Obscuribacterales bacterium]|nr:hypothetical protein [Candidatus Obscuribacterales bacterium]
MRPSWMPSIGDILFVLILCLFFVFLPNFILGDGSTGWHIVDGQYILAHGQIPQKDLISYTFADKHWVAYEWLFDLVLAILDKIGGIKMVAVACCSAIALLFALIYQECRKRGSHFISATFFCVSGALCSSIHWLARPHLVTFFEVFIFTKYLQDYFDKKISFRKLAIILSVSMLIWVNSHPAFLMGLVITGIYLVSDGLIWFCSADSEKRKESTKRIRDFAVLIAILLAVTFVNPYGLDLYKYIFEYLQQSAVWSQNDEFSSPVFHGQLQVLLLEFMYFALAIGLVCTQKKPSLARFLTVLAYAHLSLASRRNMPLFVIVSLPLITELIANSRFSVLASTDEKALEPSGFLQGVKQKWQKLGESIDAMEFTCTRHALPAVAVLVLFISCLSGGKIMGLKLVNSDFDPHTKPSKTLAWLKEDKLEPNVGMNYDNWG